MRFLYFLNGLTTSTWGRFGVIYYILRGLSAEEIGIIEGVMPVVQAVSTFFWGYIADLTKSKKIVFFITRVLSACILVMLAFDALAPDFIHIFVISVGSQAFTSDSMLDAWTLDMLGDHAKLMYGRVRLWMAVSWGFGAFGMSWITQYYGFDWNFIVYGGLAVISAYPIIRLIPSKTPVEEAMGDCCPDWREACAALFNSQASTSAISASSTSLRSAASEPDFANSPSLAPRAQPGFFFSADLSSSSIANSFFLTVLSWVRILNSAAFFCSLANLFSYLETFFSVGFMNFPLRSLTAMLSSLISNPLFLTSNSMSYF